MTSIFLACPYTHKDKRLRTDRVNKATRMSALLANTGASVYSPLTHTVALEKAGVKKTKHEWLMFNRPFLDSCSVVFVLTLPGWMESEGVQQEVKYARLLKKPIFFVSLDYGMDTVFTTWGIGIGS